MSRTFSPTIASATSIAQAVETTIPNSLDAILTEHAGDGAPSYAKAHTVYADTTAGVMKQRNAANDGDVELYPLGRRVAVFSVPVLLGDLTPPLDRYLWVAPENVTITRLVLVASTATSSSSGNEVVFQLTNLTQAEDLFSDTVGTHTGLVGVGGGADLAADTPFALAPDQNADLVAGDVLELQLTVEGSPAAADLDRCLVVLEGYRRA